MASRLGFSPIFSSNEWILACNVSISFSISVVSLYVFCRFAVLSRRGSNEGRSSFGSNAPAPASWTDEVLPALSCDDEGTGEGGGMEMKEEKSNGGSYGAS